MPSTNNETPSSNASVLQQGQTNHSDMNGVSSKKRKNSGLFEDSTNKRTKLNKTQEVAA
jgi:hypothetical protein